MEGQAGASGGEAPRAENVLAGQPVRERSERRQYARYGVDCPAKVTILSGAAVIEGRLSDLSLGGCRMVTPEPVSLGILARVEVNFELRGCAFRMVGVTAGTRAKRSFGLRFLEMPARRAEALTELLEEIQRMPDEPQAGGKESMLAPMEQVAAKKRPAAEVIAEKQAAEKLAQPADVANGDCIPGSSPVVKPPERRSHARHSVDTRVNLTLIRGAITMPGQILNLSQGGCRLRTDEPFSVGIYTRVEAEFFLHGLPFRLAGVSQAILDKNTIGIRFLDMSERKRGQLTELIAEIEEMQRTVDGER